MNNARTRVMVVTIVAASSLAACDKSGTPIASSDSSVAALPQVAGSGSDTAYTRIAEIRGFDGPESAVYDSAQDVWFVSNIVGGPTTHDHNGFISRLRGDGSMDSLRFIDSGRNGVVLDGPKGLAIDGDTLWAADIDVMRAFSTRTGAPIRTVSFRDQKAKLLNGVTVGPDGAIYITDTGIKAGAGGATNHTGPDRIFRIDDGSASVAIENADLAGPNGIAWDPDRDAFIVASFAGNSINSWKPGQNSVSQIASGPGQFDGLARLADGRVLISSWADSSLYELDGSELRRVVAGGLPTPADFHVGSRAMRVFIPLSSQNSVVVYSIARRDSVPE